MMTLLYVLHFMVCFVLIGVVLLQRGKGSDLGAALGGGGANTVFGSRGAGNFLTKLTTASAVLFMTTSLSLAYLGTEQADVQLFDPNAVESEEPAPGGLAPIDDTAAPDEGVGGLEEIPAPEAGGLEEIDPTGSGGEQP
ncbi:MAG TPA: preprotein translocase subunit SecG [Alphaproteobacteria bacterium]|nr:preprotein translocase subunit SecG [Alphaproteobacteria bacterium]